MDLEAHVQQLLALPPAREQEERHAKSLSPAHVNPLCAPLLLQLTAGLGIEVRQDAGEGKGKGVFATRAFRAGELVFKEPPLAAIQHTDNRAVAEVCAHCFRFVGSVEQQAALQIAAARVAAAAAEGSDAASDDSDGSSGGNAMQREAALALEEGQVEALASGALRLPHTDAFPLPSPVPCPGGCEEERYCSAACAAAAWEQYHQLLCCGPGADEGSDAARGKGKGKSKAAPAAAGSSSSGSEDRQQRRRRAALREFLHLADETNDVFRLAAVVVARTLLAAQQLLDSAPAERGASAASASGSSGGGSSGGSAEPSADACWRALLQAWAPFAAGHKGLWWECTAAPPEAAADMRQLAADSLELLAAALPPALARRFPALLDLRVWGSIIGMFELNNLAVVVPSPVARWLQALEELPEQEQGAAYLAAGPFIDSLPEEIPCCEGNAFYALHSCCNHSCAPNAEAFKRDEDDDGSAVILALRDIQAGEEVTLSYIDEEAPLAERREQMADYGFACACDKCAAEELAEELGGLTA